MVVKFVPVVPTSLISFRSLYFPASVPSTSRNNLSLLRNLDAPTNRMWWLSKNTAVEWHAATSKSPATSMEELQLNAVFITYSRDGIHRYAQFPVGSNHAAILVTVRQPNRSHLQLR